jgi:hypothetical protein
MFYLDVAIAIHVRCKCVFQMFQLFYLDVVRFHMLQWQYNICCKCIFQMFHLLQTYVASVLSGCSIYCSGYAHMLQMYVSPCFQYGCNRCCTPRALTCGQPRATPSAPTPPGVVPHCRACSRLNTCASALRSIPLSLALGHALCSLFLSHWGSCTMLALSLACSYPAGVSLVLGHARCGLSLALGTHAMFSLACN